MENYLHKYTFVQKFFLLPEKQQQVFVSFIQNENDSFQKQVLILINLLLKKQEPLSKEHIFKTIYNKSYNDTAFRWLLANANQYLDKFLACEWFLHQESLSQLGLLKAYKQHEWNHWFELKYNQLKKEREYKLISEETYDSDYEFEKIWHQYVSETTERQIQPNIEELDKKLDTLYLYKKLKYVCDALNRRKIFKKSFTIRFIDVIIHADSFKEILNTNKGIFMYYNIYQLLSTNHELYFNVIQEKIKDSWNEFEKRELKDIFSYLQNFCIQQINKGNVEYLQTLFSLYTLQLEKNIIIQDNAMYLFDFKNIATLGIRLKQYEWVEEFTEKYVHLIPKESRQSAASFNYARIYFAQKKFKKVLKELLQVQFSDIYYELGARVLIIKVYMEQDDLPLAETSITSFKSYINRDKNISTSQKEIYMNFLTHTLWLAKYSQNHTLLRKKFELFKQTPNITEKDWLQSKYEEYL